MGNPATRNPSASEWSILKLATHHNNIVTEPYGRGARRIPTSLHRHGWIDDGRRLTDLGLQVVAAWRYDSVSGELRPADDDGPTPCERCMSRYAVGICCTAHSKPLCHGCYRRSHFVEVCVAGCVDCAREGLDPSTARPAEVGHQ